MTTELNGTRRTQARVGDQPAAPAGSPSGQQQPTAAQVIELPDDVRRLIVQYAERAARMALFRAGKVSYRWVLHDAPRLSVTLHLSDSPADSERQVKVLRGVQRALRVRGSRHTRMSIHLTTTNQEPLVQLAEMLRTVGGGVTEVRIYAPEVTAAALQALGAALPAMHTLYLCHGCSHDAPTYIDFTLPAEPTCLPALRSLHLARIRDAPAGDVYGSLQPYLTHLTSLQQLPPTYGCTTLPQYLTTIQSLQSGSPWSLRTLSIADPLDDALAATLATHAPALEELTVQFISMTRRAQVKWRVRHVRMVGRKPHAFEICRLPPTYPGIKTIVHLTSPVEAELSAALQEVFTPADLDHLHVSGFISVSATVSREVPDAQVPHLLAAAVPVFQVLTGKDSVLTFSDFPLGHGCAAPLCQVVAAGYERVDMSVRPHGSTPDLEAPLPAFNHLDLGESPSVGLDWLLRYASAVRSIRVPWEALVAPEAAERAWPWQQVSAHSRETHTVWLEELDKLPDPSQHGEPVELALERIDLGLHDAQAPERLQHFKLHLYKLGIVATGPPEQHPAELHAMFEVMRRLQLTRVTSLALQGWVVTAGLLDVLRGILDWGVTNIPNWRSASGWARLQFTQCEWAAEHPAVYRSLGELIPVSLGMVALGQCPEEVALAVCCGAASARTQRSHLLVHVKTEDQAGVERIKQHEQVAACKMLHVHWDG